MTTTLKTYSKYKESSLEWTAGIPSDWEKRRFKFIFNLIKRPINIDDEIVTAFRDGTVTLRSNRKEDGFTIALKEIGYQGVRRGDLVISGMDGFAGAIGISDSDGKATPVYSVCQPIQKSVFPSYYKYLLRVLALSGYISILARGIRERSTEFKWNIIGNLLLVVPDFETQKNIADFLDEKTKVIDELVAIKEKMIELLREKRAALITRVVTKGLDPKVKMKPSGIDWLGGIPTEWKKLPLKFLFSYQSGGVWGDEARNDENDLICVRVADFDFVEFIAQSNDFTYRNLPDIKKWLLLDENSILLEKSGGGDQQPVGRTVRYLGQEKATCSNFIQKLQVDKKYNSEFIILLLSTLYFNGVTLKVIKKTTGIQNLDLPAFLRTDIFLPSKNEQKQIVDFVNVKSTNIIDSIKKVNQQIDQLKEYRSSLIYSAVTGKIKI